VEAVVLAFCDSDTLAIKLLFSVNLYPANVENRVSS